MSYYVKTEIKTGSTSSKLMHRCNVDEPGVLKKKDLKQLSHLHSLTPHTHSIGCD